MVGSVARLPSMVSFGRLTQDTARLDFFDDDPEIKRHLYWVLRTPQYRDYCHGRVTGSASASFSREDFLSYRVPTLTASSRVLTLALDAMEGKIEQNRRSIEALERLSRAIFRAWFVDFEPVKAKAAGAASFPSMPPDVFDSLPSCFGEDGNPIGWTFVRLDQLCDVNARTVRKSEVKGVIEYVDISSVDAGRLIGPTLVNFDEAPSRARRCVRHGDTIWSCVRPNRQAYLFVHSPPANRIVSTGFAVLSPTSVSPAFLNYSVTQPEFVDYLVANADGSAYPAVRPDHFASATLLKPSRSVLDAFEQIAMPAQNLIASLESESRKLAELRDYLLPRLLSGKVRVRDAEAIAESA